MTDRENRLAFNDLGIGFHGGSAILLPLTGTAARAELIAVIGRNGIGKSTLLRTFSGLQQHLSGHLIVEGTDIKSYSRKGLSARVGYISTEIVRVSNMRVHDLVSLGRFPHTNWMGRIDSVDREYISSALSMTGMTDLSERPIFELSDGERQRAIIAMVLAQNAGIMIMDEPTAFLDITGRYGMIHLLHKLTRERQKTVIFSTHDLLMAVRLAGSFKTLFDDSEVEFDPVRATISLRKQEKGKIRIKGEGAGRYWTEQAIIRAGFSVAEWNAAIEIEVLPSPVLHWAIRSEAGDTGFNNLYDLIEWIRTQLLTS